MQAKFSRWDFGCLGLRNNLRRWWCVVQNDRPNSSAAIFILVDMDRQVIDRAKTQV